MWSIFRKMGSSSKESNKMKLYIIILLMLLCGCSASNRDVTSSYNLPKELEDYKVVQLYSDSGNCLYVLVKKNKEDREVIGTTEPGKVTYHTIVIDGEEYVKKEQR